MLLATTARSALLDSPVPWVLQATPAPMVLLVLLATPARMATMARLERPDTVAPRGTQELVGLKV